MHGKQGRNGTGGKMTEMERSMKRSMGYGDISRQKPKKRKKSPHKAAVKYCDEWFAQFIKLRDKRCVTCGSTDNLQCSHIFQGRHESTKWRDDCAYTQCKGCHHSFHVKSQMPLLRYAERQVGHDWLDYLWELNNKTVKHTSDEIMAIGDKYREKVRE
jgi:hypothetical protein